MDKILTKDEETIVAQCTPSGAGAIALIRLSGNNVRTIVGLFSKLPNSKKIENIPSGTINFGWIIDADQNHIDQVMFLVMDGPKTFTGQNTIEITCHNNQFLIEKIIAESIKHGARIAAQGEFTKRAFLNNKIDLLQAEAINELIHANTQMALKKSLEQLEGSFSHWISIIEKELIKALAWCEASFEFLDEEQVFGPQIINSLEILVKKIEKLKKTFDLQKNIREGVKVAIIGSVNAGKSSIFNSLLSQKRAIVTDIAGTTRDVIESGIYHNGNFITLVDTAGLRQTKDVIEQEGIKRSFEEAQKSDLIILVFDGSKKLTDQELNIYEEILNKYKNKIILVQNKSDLKTNKNNQLLKYNPIQTSSLENNINNNNFKKLESKIDNKISALFSQIESPFLLNKRQFNNLTILEQKLINTISLIKNTKSISYELLSYDLRDAIEYISELTGKTVSEYSLDTVFKEFCVGK